MPLSIEIKSEELLACERAYFSQLNKQLNLDSNPEKNLAWLITGNWKKYAHECSKFEKAFISITGDDENLRSLRALFWGNVVQNKPTNIKFLTHAPLAYKNFQQVKKMPGVEYLALPYLSGVFQERQDNAKKTVGCVGPFKEESHLVFFLTVAHYILRTRNDIEFCIVGQGPLKSHYERIIKDLDLAKNIRISDSETLDFDVLLYCPLWNYSFIPVLMAAATGVAVVGMQFPGIQELIKDSETGFLFETSDTKSAGELVTRLIDRAELRKGLASRLRDVCKNTFSIHSFKTQLENFLWVSEPKKTSQAA